MPFFGADNKPSALNKCIKQEGGKSPFFLKRTVRVLPATICCQLISSGGAEKNESKNHFSLHRVQGTQLLF